MGSSRIVLDSQPVVALLQNEAGADVVRELVRRAEARELELLISVLNVTEVMYVMARRGGPAASLATLDLLQDLPLKVVPVDLELAARAAWFKAGGGIALGDSFAVALAHREGVPVLTADPEFKRVADRIEVRWLGR